MAEQQIALWNASATLGDAQAKVALMVQPKSKAKAAAKKAN
jgi:hypothetical protein